MINKYIEVLVCPVCHAGLSLADSKLICCNPGCGEDFQIVEEIPILIPKAIGDKNQEQLNHQAAWFDSHYLNFKEYRLENWRKSMLQRIFKGLDINSNEKRKSIYLDIGVGGNGYTVIEVARKGYDCIGADLSLQGVLSAKRFAKNQGVEDNVFFVVCSVEYLPFKNKYIDKISALSVLEHLYNDYKAVEEISRVSTDDGIVFITVPNAYSRMWFFLWPFYYYIDKNIGHLRHYSEEKLVDLFKSNKFACVDIFYNAHLIKFYQLLLEKIGLINDERWWSLENKDFSFRNNKMGAQLNALFKKCEIN